MLDKVLEIGDHTMVDKYSFNIYDYVKHGTANELVYTGEVIDIATGIRVHQTAYYNDEETAVNACLDWIDEQE